MKKMNKSKGNPKRLRIIKRAEEQAYKEKAEEKVDFTEFNREFNKVLNYFYGEN